MKSQIPEPEGLFLMQSPILLLTLQRYQGQAYMTTFETS